MAQMTLEPRPALDQSGRMPRARRQIFKNHCYHVINRGNNRARIFHEHADYAHFVAMMQEVNDRVPLPMLAVCLMPNHFHLVVRPTEEDSIARWTHLLCTTHVRRYHLKYGTEGRVWQGRFKSFIIQEDHHLLTVMRYVERNALRAGMVARAEHWLWGSARWRREDPMRLPLLAPPLKLPFNWLEFVNQPQTSEELKALRESVNRQRPFGNRRWVERKARDLGLMQSLGKAGRPPRS